MQFPPLSQLFSSTACFKYFSTIVCIYQFIDKVISLPFSAGIYFYWESGISCKLLPFELISLPGVPVNTSSHLLSIPVIPWLSVPQKPKTAEATVSYG